MASKTPADGLEWYKALDHDELPEGRVEAVSCGDTTVAVTHYDGEYAALDNNCPHQGGPLGEGSIETGLLRCPWHGWNFDPLTGETHGPHDDCVETFPVEERDDGIYVGFPREEPHEHGLRRDRGDADQLGRPTGVGDRRPLEHSPET